MKYKITLGKNRSDDEVSLNIEASDRNVAYNFGEAVAALMGSDEEYCTKQERLIDKDWSCNDVVELP
jgi:hypothetical protein